MAIEWKDRIGQLNNKFSAITTLNNISNEGKQYWIILKMKVGFDLIF